MSEQPSVDNIRGVLDLDGGAKMHGLALHGAGSGWNLRKIWEMISLAGDCTSTESMPASATHMAAYVINLKRYKTTFKLQEKIIKGLYL